MRLRIIFCFITIFNVSSLIAQDKYGSGYYLANGNDTVRGYIEYRTNYNYAFKFKKSLKDKSETLNINDVNQFGLDYGITYRKLDFALDDLSKSAVFAQVLVQGDINLYRYQSKLFVDGGEKKRFQLAKGKGSNSDEVKRNYQKNTGIFNILFFDCPSVKDEALKSHINSSSLSNLIIDYHQCKKLPYSELILPKARKKQVRYGVFIGIQSVSLSYSGTKARFLYLERTRFNTISQSPTIGIIRVNRGRQISSVFGLQQEVYLSKYAFEGSSYFAFNLGANSIIEESKTSIKYARIDYKIGPRISMRSNSINPYLSMGLSISGFVAVQAKSTVTTQTNSSVETREEDPIQSVLSGGAWASLGLGIRIKQRVLFFDTTVDNNSANSGHLKSFTGRIGFMF